MDEINNTNDILPFDVCMDTYRKGEKISGYLAHLEVTNYNEMKRVMAIRTKLDEIEKLLIFG